MIASAAILILWLNDFGQENPKEKPIPEKPVAIKVGELGKMSDRAFRGAMVSFWKSYDRDTPLYIINYGTSKQIAVRQRLILESMPRYLPEDPSRITLVAGGVAGKDPKTVLWKVPVGAETPVP